MATKNTTFKTKIKKANERVIRDHIQSPLYETMKMFRSYTGLTENQPLAYEEWMNLSHESKSAALYVMFFNEITLAYYKSKSFYSPEEDNVSIVLQYLEKNVPIMEKDRKRYSPKYVYQVAYNCMFCQSRGIKRDLERYEKETSNKVISGGEEYDLFDYVGDSSEMDSIIAREDFWRIIEGMGDETGSIVENLLNGTRLPAGVKQHKEAIISELRIRLAKFTDIDF